MFCVQSGFTLHVLCSVWVHPACSVFSLSSPCMFCVQSEFTPHVLCSVWVHPALHGCAREPPWDCQDPAWQRRQRKHRHSSQHLCLLKFKWYFCDDRILFLNSVLERQSSRVCFVPSRTITRIQSNKIVACRNGNLQLEPRWVDVLEVFIGRT